jgi:hypothetical protein
VLEVVALIFQHIECLIFNSPPRAPASSHDLINGPLVHAQVGDPTKVLALAPDSFPALQKVDS